MSTPAAVPRPGQAIHAYKEFVKARLDSQWLQPAFCKCSGFWHRASHASVALMLLCSHAALMLLCSRAAAALCLVPDGRGSLKKLRVYQASCNLRHSRPRCWLYVQGRSGHSPLGLMSAQNPQPSLCSPLLPAYCLPSHAVRTAAPTQSRKAALKLWAQPPAAR